MYKPKAIVEQKMERKWCCAVIIYPSFECLPCAGLRSAVIHCKWHCL